MHQNTAERLHKSGGHDRHRVRIGVRTELSDSYFLNLFLEEGPSSERARFALARAYWEGGGEDVRHR